jgi:hypothetical protein
MATILFILLTLQSLVFAQAEVKIFSLLAPDRGVEKDLPELKNPLIYGLSWRFRWKTIEPQEGQYNWAMIDRAMGMTAEAGKVALLRLVAGMHTPEWVYTDGAKSLHFGNNDVAGGERHPPGTRMPIPWDDVYLNKWEAFLRAFGKRYNGNSHIYSVAMSGGGYIDEMNLPKAFERWRQVGYTDEKLIQAWKRIIDAYQRAFPDTPTNLAINEPLGSLQRSNVLSPVVSYVLATYPRKVYLQQNSLKADFPRDSRIRQIIREASARTIVGYQMLGGKGFLDEQTGDRGVTFQHAREDNASYVEVYAPDVRDPGLRGALQFLGRRPERR